MDKNTVSIRIFDKDINFLGEVDNYTSLFFIRRWEQYGEFEIHIRKVNDLFSKGNIIALGKDKRNVGIIEHIEIKEDTEDEIIIKGFSLLYLLNFRLTEPPPGKAYHAFNTNVEDIIIGLVKANAIDPLNQLRKIPHLTFETSLHRGERLEFQSRFKNLADEITKLSKSSGLGVTIDLDYKQKKLILKVLEGRDLTFNQNVNPPAIFSVEYDNIRSQNYFDSNIGYKNVGYIGGQGEGESRALEVLNDNLSGLDRREVFIDARDIDENSSLEDRGKVKLAETPRVENFECVVDPKGYKETWDLGDLVTINSKRYKRRINNRVTEIKEVYEPGNFKIEPTFGNSVPIVTEKIKQMNDAPLNEGIKGDTGSSGVQGPQGFSIDYAWNGTQLGVKREDETSYVYKELKGSIGATGPQGTPGVKGDIGLIGPKGDTGLTGAQGPKGDIGERGQQGIQGIQGQKGDIGLRGLQGPQGVQGLKGDQGVQGPAGNGKSYVVFHEHFIAIQGQTLFEWNDGYVYPINVNAISIYLNGIRLSNRIINQIRGNAIQFKVPLNDGDKVFVEAFQMVVDLQGPQGIPGVKGATGEQGATGPQGTKGDKGLTGDRGPQGIQGIAGAKGDVGATGPQGIQGLTGAQGATGNTGAVGAKGDTWRPTVNADGNLTWALNNGTTIPVAQNIKGPQGIAGLQGPQGIQGVPGKNGTNGATGPQGATGAQGLKGTDGTLVITSSSKPTGQINGRVWVQLI